MLAELVLHEGVESEFRDELVRLKDVVVLRKSATVA
jgi:hypothetical protein